MCDVHRARTRVLLGSARRIKAECAVHVHYHLLLVSGAAVALPLQPNKERPWRRYDQDAESTATRWVPASAAPLHLLNNSGASYRLDVELGRLEFEVHPYMALEQQLVRLIMISRPCSWHVRF